MPESNSDLSQYSGKKGVTNRERKGCLLGSRELSRLLRHSVDSVVEPSASPSTPSAELGLPAFLFLLQVFPIPN